MVPTVAQQLRAIRHTLAKTIVPAIDPDAGFAQEQLGLILASLDWVLDVQASEHRYELVEHSDAQALLQGLLELDGVPGEAAGQGRAALTEPAAADLAELRAQTLRLKVLIEQAYTALADSPESKAAVQLIAATAARQSRRELAWARMTGFPKNVDGDVAAVLADQSEQSEQSEQSQQSGAAQ